MHNLSGAWRGLFSYPAALEPVSFEARLAHSEDWLSGSTTELATAGTDSSGRLSATLTGRVEGGQVTFLKTYDRHSLHYDSVHYAGEVDADGQEIWGHWTVPGSWSGTFLMIRANQARMALGARWAERV